MATADTSIYGQVGRTSRIQSPYEQQNMLSQVLQGVNQNRMAEMQMRQAEAAQEKQNRLSSILSANYETPEMRDTALTRGGFIDEAQKLSKSRLEGAQTQATTQKTLADAEKVKLATAIEKIGTVGQLLGGVRDQVTYDQARAQAQAMGLDVSNMPPQYDPALVEQKRAQSLNMEQQLAQVWKQKGYDLDVQKFGETKRSNLASEGLQKRGQDITVRGQNLTDARGREANALKSQEIQMGGKPPPGYRWNGANLEAIPGGPGDKLPESQQKQVVGVNNLSNAISEYRDELKKFGTFDAASPDKRAAMGTKYNNMMLQAKEAYNLGVLNGPDLDILTAVITDPRSLKGVITSKGALDQQASELDRIMQGIGQVSGQARQPQNKPGGTQKPVGQGGFKILSVE